MSNPINYEILFEVGDTVQFNHPEYGSGKGIIATYVSAHKEFVVIPNKKIKGIDYIVCKIPELISTPF